MHLSTKKYASVQEIFDALITHYDLRSYNGLAMHLGIPYQTLMAWKKRDSIGDPSIFMDKCIGIRREWLLTGEGEMFTPEETEQNYGRAAAGMVKVPLYNAVAQAGPGAYNENQDIESFLSFSREYARLQFGTAGPSLACLRASGDSMFPYIHPGDVLVVDQADRYLTRDGAVYILQIDETTVVKRLQRLSGEVTRIASDNPTGWSRDCTLEDFKKDHIEILGRVVAVMKLA